MPPDVRKRFALPFVGTKKLGLRPKSGRSPKTKYRLAGRPEAFRTSDGPAVLAKEFSAKPLVDTAARFEPGARS